MRRVMFAILLLVATLILAAHFGQLEEFVGAVRRGQPAWIAGAFAVQLLWQAAQIEQFRATHRLASCPQGWRSIAPVVLANNFILIAAPSGSLSTFALFIGDARRRGLPLTAVTLGVVLFAVAEYLGLIIMLMVALPILYSHPLVYTLELPPAIIILAVTVVMVALLGIALKSVRLAERMLAAAARPLNGVAQAIFRRPFLSQPDNHQFAAAFAKVLASLPAEPPLVWVAPLVISLLGKGLLVLLLGAVCIAFNCRLAPLSLIACIALASTFTIVSPTPLGLGVVEGALALALLAFGAPPETALLISLTYRGFTLWLPMLYGFAALQVSGLKTVFAGSGRA